MKKLLRNVALMISAAAMTASCGDGAAKTNTEMQIDNKLTEAEKQAGVFTPEVMWKMGRLSSTSLSPDGTGIVYAVAYYSLEENKSISSLWTMPFEGGEPVQVTDNAGSDNSPAWSSDGKSVYFLSNRSGERQIWKLDVASGAIMQLSAIDGGVDGFGVAPSGDKVFYAKKVAVEKRESSAIYPDLDKSKALIYDDLMERHWDYWDRGDYYHIFISDINGGKVGQGKDIMEGEPWDAPMAPYFDMHEIAWSNAGDKLAYTCKKKTGKEYATTTDSDIYVYDLASGVTENITEGMPGYDKYPVFSPDGKKIAFQSMATPRYEADKTRLFVHDFQTGQKSYLTRDFDYNADNTVWEGNDAILFISPIEATYQLCRAGMDSRVEVLTAGDHDINSFSMAGDNVVCELTTLRSAPEIYAIDKGDGKLTQLSFVNKEIYDNIKMPEVEKRWVATTDGKSMLTWVILPPDFNEDNKYPALLYCQGGPQSVVSQRWSYRWNYALMAAQGYVVVAPNRRGLPSFGQEWLHQISGDYSGQNIQDYLSAIDNVSKESWVDENRLGCVGASYGGYSSYFLAGNDGNRFKAFVAHCGIFNFESMYGSTEELFFVDYDYGGPYWSNNPVAKRSYANSPHKFVEKWHAPILILVGLKDYRVPYTQSLEAFTAARMRDIPARLVAFENEAHQVFQPQNNIVWNTNFFEWLDKYVKNAQ